MRHPLALLALVLLAPAWAADSVAPPEFTGVAAPAVTPPEQSAPATAPSPDDSGRLEPNAADIERAAERKKRAGHAQPEPLVSWRGTKIEEINDQNNRLTEVKVTPRQTEIPYTMRNRSDRPIETRPGADSRSTLDTPKFIHFGW